MTPGRITRDQLAILLENEAHNAFADLIRRGHDPGQVLGDGHGRLNSSCLRPRYRDAESETAIATFDDVVTGRIQVI